jgi:ATP-dependent DNA ligase
VAAIRPGYFPGTKRIWAKDIKELLARAQQMGLEGLIGKSSGSRYEAGKRTGAWVKIKLHQEQEFSCQSFKLGIHTRTV